MRFLNVQVQLIQEVVKDRHRVNSALAGNLPLLVKVTILRIVPRLENICEEKNYKFRIWVYCTCKASVHLYMTLTL